MKTAAIIQARIGSTRLPSKVLKDLYGKTMLARVVERVRRAATVDEVLVATTDQPADEAIVEECARIGVGVFRGSEDDVLDRYFRAAQSVDATTVVRICSDCPLADPGIIDELVRLNARGADYTSNNLEYRTYPYGLDAEVMTADALAKAWRDAVQPTEREHVTPYLYRHPELFKLTALRSPNDYSHLRWTVDTPEDFDLMQRIYRELKTEDFTWTDVIAVLNAHPDWSAINAHVQQKKV